MVFYFCKILFLSLIHIFFQKNVKCTIFLKLLITPYSFGVVWFLTCLLWNSAPLLDNGAQSRLASRQSISVLWRQAVMALLLTHASSPTMLCQPVLFLPFLTSSISTNIHIYGFNQISISFWIFLYFILLCLFSYNDIVILICLFVNIFFWLYKLY